MERKIIKFRGKDYLQIGNKLLPIDRFEKMDQRLIPIIKVESKEIKYPDGRQDVIIKVPTLQITGFSQALGTEKKEE